MYIYIFGCAGSMQDLVPCPGVKPRAPVLGVWSLSQRTTRKSRCTRYFMSLFPLTSMFFCSHFSVSVLRYSFFYAILAVLRKHHGDPYIFVNDIIVRWVHIMFLALFFACIISFNLHTIFQMKYFNHFILQMKKLEFREIKYLASHHPAIKYGIQICFSISSVLLFFLEDQA